MLCLRFLNWPIQRQQRLLPADQRSRIALHTALSADGAAARKDRKASGKADADIDLAFVRQLFSAARHGPCIVSVSEDAWRAAVRPGMPLAEARSLAAPVVRQRRTRTATAAPQVTLFVPWCPEDDRRELQALAEHIRRFAPIIGMDSGPVPDSLLLDITGCAPLFGGEAALAEQLLKTLQTQGLRAQAAISDTVATAFAFAHPGGHFLQAATERRVTQQRGPAAHSAEWDLPVIIIPPGQADSWLHNLPIAAARIPLADAAVLSQLGILTLKQLLGLPFEDLPSRISAVAVQRLRQIRGLDEELIVAIPEANPISAIWVSEYPATSHAEVRQVLDHLVDDIVQQLQRRRVATMRLSCQLKPQSGSSTPLIGEVVKPVQSADQLKDVLFLKLDAVRLSEPVYSVTMRAQAAALPIARQQDLFSRSEHMEPAEELATVINRLSNRLGTQAVLTADSTTSPVPETAIQVRPVIAGGRAGRNMDHRLSDLVTPDPDAAGPVPAFNVPLKLLPVPVLIAQANHDVLTQGFLWNGQSFTVTQATGPDRLQTHWWHDVAVHRDYYRVTTQVGAEFWLFKNLVDNQWYLHGVFE